MGCRIISEAKKISNKRVKRKQDVVQHISGKCVEDRKLFMECVGGDIDKYKYSIKLESSNLGNVWIGVEAKPSLIITFVQKIGMDRRQHSLSINITKINLILP